MESESVVVDGVTVMFSPQDKGGVAAFLRKNGNYEAALGDFFKNALSSGDTVLDIGANIGFFSVFFSKWVGDTGRVLAFEPEPNNREFIRANLSNNSRHNVTVFSTAVSDKAGETTFYVDPAFWGVHSLGRKNVANSAVEMQVETVALDEFLPAKLGKSERFVAKLDTQGAEPLIFKGGERMFRDRCKLLAFEYWPFGVKTMGFEPEDSIKMLYDLGFSLSTVPKKEKFKTFQMDDLIARLQAKNMGDMSSTNLVGLKAPAGTKFQYETFRDVLNGH